MARTDDLITFSEEKTPAGQRVSGSWKIVVVDDDATVHSVTRMVLKNFVFEDKDLEILSAYSDAEARDLLARNPDTAVVFLDVVMKEEDSGLKTVKYIREELANNLVRIILRTGQPGLAPEKKIIVDYDINDYKLKTELTADKLFVTLVAALRAYGDLLILEYNRIGLEKIIESSAFLFHQQNFREFITGVLIQLTALMKLDRSAVYCRTSALSATRTDGRFLVEAAVGDFSEGLHLPIDEVLPPKALEQIHEALKVKKSVYYPYSFVAYFRTMSGMENIIYFTASREIRSWDKKLIEIFCSNISVGLDNLSLGQEIENTQKEIIETLGEVAEARSRETGHHVKRVAEYAALLARLSGLAEDEVEMIKMASPMHDIGKLAIPDAILNKPGELSADELIVIRTHAQAGHDMLGTSQRPLMKIAALIALEHHEKYDGTGYPAGKKGLEISIHGRIVAIADVYDALGCDRVYKKAWPQGRIIEFFRTVRGTWFDPVLTDLFLDHLDEIAEVRNRFPD